MEKSVTELLRRAAVGDREAEQELIDQVYPDLHALAKIHFRLERQPHTLQPTALVNEVYVKLMGGNSSDWKDRAHFFAVASRAMRQVLIDHARSVCSKKRGGRERPVPLEEHFAVTEEHCTDILILDEALTSLEKVNPRLAKVVVCRYFGDMTEAEIAEAFEISTRTVKRDWEFSKAWLRDWLSR